MERSFGWYVGVGMVVCRYLGMVHGREKAWERPFGRYVGVGMVARRIKSQKETLMLVLKYNHCRISTGVLICLYSGHLTSSTKIEVLLCFHVTHSRIHSHIYNQFFI